MVIIVKFVLRNPKKLLEMIAINGYSQAQYAHHISISKSCLNYIIHYKRNPSPTTARKIAQGIGKTIPDIFLIKMLTKKTKKEVR